MAARRKRRRSLHPFAEAAQAAESARLRYVTDARAGLTRRRSGGGFLYFWLDGRRISDRPTLKRIRDLVIPPAWTSVWISPLSDGHLQATGRDARGRKQYRYHERWRRVPWWRPTRRRPGRRRIGRMWDSMWFTTSTTRNSGPAGR